MDVNIDQTWGNHTPADIHNLEPRWLDIPPHHISALQHPSCAEDLVQHECRFNGGLPQPRRPDCRGGLAAVQKIKDPAIFRDADSGPYSTGAGSGCGFAVEYLLGR